MDKKDLLELDYFHRQLLYKHKKSEMSFWCCKTTTTQEEEKNEGRGNAREEARGRKLALLTSKWGLGKKETLNEENIEAEEEVQVQATTHQYQQLNASRNAFQQRDSSYVESSSSSQAGIQIVHMKKKPNAPPLILMIGNNSHSHAFVQKPSQSFDSVSDDSSSQKRGSDSNNLNIKPSSFLWAPPSSIRCDSLSVGLLPSLRDSQMD